MDWWTAAPAVMAFLWLLVFIDDNAVLELRLLFHTLTKLACHLYLALLQQRRAVRHIFHCVSHILYSLSRAILQFVSRIVHGVSDILQCVTDIVDAPKEFLYVNHREHGARTSALHFIEAMSVVCETVPNLTCAALSVGAAFCHAMQAGFYVLAATLRTLQTCLFSQTDSEKEMWIDERQREKETEKMIKSKVLQYMSVAGDDPATALRINLGMPASVHS